MKDIVVHSIIETEKFAKDFAKELKPKDVVCLIGDLGVGKTVVAKSICKYFGVEEDVISPTFNIVKTYKTKDKKIKYINHFDLYRLKSDRELIDIDFDDYIYNDNVISLIEWPEIAMEVLTKNIVTMKIMKIDENSRKIKIDGIFNKGASK